MRPQAQPSPLCNREIAFLTLFSQRPPVRLRPSGKHLHNSTERVFIAYIPGKNHITHMGKPAFLPCPSTWETGFPPLSLHTGTPGAACPITQARRTPSPQIPTS